MPDGRLLAISVGRPKPFPHRGKTVKTAIAKVPVDGPVRVEGINVVGDDQADRSVHGGPDQAVYAYAREDYAWWEDVLGRDMPPGTFGENLLFEGLPPLGELAVGTRLQVGGDLVLEATAPRIPCFKLSNQMDDSRFLKRFAAARRPGTYLRIVAPGTIAAGDEVRVASVPTEHDVTIGFMNEVILFERARKAELLVAGDDLAERVRDWAQS